jgi:CBS domain-containing protein
MTAPVVTVGVDDPVPKIAATLNRHRISAVPVIDSDGAVVGLVSEFDLLARPAGGTAREVMTTAVITVTESTEVDDVRRLLVDRRIHRVPVVSAGSLVGIVSRADIVALLITEWVCRVCGESSRGEQAPALCPKCHSADAFVVQEQLPGS